MRYARQRCCRLTTSTYCWAVAVEEVDEVEPQPLERPVDRLHQVLAVERVAHVHAPSWMPQNNLVEMHVAVALPAELGDAPGP